MVGSPKLPIKVGDYVTVIAGFHRQKTGKVIQIKAATGHVLVAGLNLKFKHLKPKGDSKVGNIQQVEAFLHHSNLKLTLPPSS